MRLHHPFSLKARLILSSLLWILVTLMVAWFVLISTFRNHLEQQFDDMLETHLHQLLAELSDNKGHITLEHPMSDPRFGMLYSKLYWQVNMQGRPSVHSPSLSHYTLRIPDDIPPDGKKHKRYIDGPMEQKLLAMICNVSMGHQPVFVTVMVAADYTDVNQSVARFSDTVLVTMVIIGSGLLFTVMFQIWGGLYPLELLHEKLTAIRGGQAHSIDGRFPSELQPMIDEFNALISHNAQVLERARMQVANLAHGLKTPLAVLSTFIAHSETIVRQREERALLQKQVHAIERQIDYTLARARAASSADVPGTSCDVSGQLDALIRALDVLYRDRGIHITFVGEHGLHAKVETQDFCEIMGNLLDNACKWSKSKVTITAGQHDERLVINVDDDGEGLPASKREIVFRRGNRLNDDVPGSGLGLAIARDLAEAYGGRIVLEDSVLNGLRVSLELPAVFQPPHS